MKKVTYENSKFLQNYFSIPNNAIYRYRDNTILNHNYTLLLNPYYKYTYFFQLSFLIFKVRIALNMA